MPDDGAWLLIDDGNVTLAGMHAPVSVEAEGDAVAVSWSSLTGKEESVVVNSGGEVRLELPQGGFLLEARARYGRVHTAFPWVRVGDDGPSAATYGVPGPSEVRALLNRIVQVVTAAQRAV